MDAHPGTEQPNRNDLAKARTRLANERTMLAYLRTALMLAVTGATLIKIYSTSLPAALTGWTLVGLAVGVGTVGAKRFLRLARELQ